MTELDSPLFRVAPRPQDPSLPQIRARPEDFAVEEIAIREPEGEGHHTYLWVEKRGTNTVDVVRQLAEVIGVDPTEVGYAGLKDKHAVARQWFSVLGLEPTEAEGLAIPGLTVLRVAKGPRRLRPGMLQGNRFRLVVRNVSEALGVEARERLGELQQRGMPNRFGLQRFGGGGRNIRLGLEVLQGRGKKHHRRTRKFLISALQSAVFNEVLRRRPVSGHEVVPGDLVIHHASDRLEVVTDPAEWVAPLKAFEVSATGPLFGFKARQPGPRVARLEHEVLDDFGLGDLYGMRLPRGVRLYGGRRPVRAPVGSPTARWEDGALHLNFELPAGSYATVLLEELFPQGFTEGPEEGRPE